MQVIKITTGIGEGRDGKPLKGINKKLDTVRKHLGQTFGGYTEVKTFGGWVNDKGKLIQENTRTYEIGTNAKRGTIIAASAKVRDVMQQQCVAVTINNKMEMV